MAGYRLGQQVTGVVERILPFGVFVRLPDETRAYIRRRDLDLDADADPARVVREGAAVTAQVVGLPDGEKHLELSRRALLPDPWKEFARRYHQGDSVAGTVHALAANGVFVRLAPGVQGFVPLAELASWPVARPDDLLWVGDAVEAVITHLAPEKRRVSLSIRARQDHQERALALVAPRRPAADPDGAIPPGDARPVAELEALPPNPGPRAQAGPVLVVDDDPPFRQTLTEWLCRQGFRCSAAESLAAARGLLDHDEYRVVLLDLNLRGENGLNLVRWLHERGTPLLVVLMSSAEQLASRTAEIEAAGVTEVLEKPLDLPELDRFLRQRAPRAAPPAWGATGSQAAPAKVHDLLAASDPGTGTAPGRVGAALQNMVDLLRAETGLLFRRDSASGRVTILAQAGAAPLNLAALYTLDDSPVGDVIRERTTVLETHASEHHPARFSKLCALLPFESCIGVPIAVHDDVQHGAFFFHRNPAAFSSYRLRDAQAGAVLFAALLEAEAIDERIQLLNPLLLMGELSSGFGHEVVNKISGLELQLKNLIARQARGPLEPEALPALADQIEALKETVIAFQDLRGKAVLSSFAVNDVIRRAVALQQPIANKARTRLALDLAAALPPAAGNPVAFQQVVLNLILNAVQQMAQAPAGPRHLSVWTCRAGETIQVRFADTGPGIHKQLWGKIFAPGFSTRGGTGLGLYIARSFLATMHGRIGVEASVIPLGTTFLVELPVAPVSVQGD
jgi:signal transduction histidine kinase/predicted RNA-binding protein with RPS1 domain/ActR/RegA family two-component response regulator